MESLVERLDKLKQDGYTENFTVKEDQLLNAKGEALEPGSVKIDETYRIEGDSDPTHQTIIYTLSSTDNSLKGVLVDSYGPNSSIKKTEMIEAIIKKN